MKEDSPINPPSMNLALWLTVVAIVMGVVIPSIYEEPKTALIAAKEPEIGQPEISEPLHFLHTLAVVFVLTLVLLFAFSSRSRATVTTSPEVAGESGLDLTPWRHARIAGGFISIATIACYIALAQ